jgi:hypothetical protein
LIEGVEEPANCVHCQAAPNTNRIIEIPARENYFLLFINRQGMTRAGRVLHQADVALRVVGLTPDDVVISGKLNESYQ